MNLGRSQFEWNYEITEFVKNKKIGMCATGANKMKMGASLTLEPAAKGTKLICSSDYEPPYSVLCKIVDKLRARKTMGKQLGNIKRALEA